MRPPGEYPSGAPFARSIAYVDRLTAERDALRAEAVVMNAANDELWEWIAALSDAFDKYGQHEPDCGDLRFGCTCGLAETRHHMTEMTP